MDPAKLNHLLVKTFPNGIEKADVAWLPAPPNDGMTFKTFGRRAMRSTLRATDVIVGLDGRRIRSTEAVPRYWSGPASTHGCASSSGVMDGIRKWSPMFRNDGLVPCSSTIRLRGLPTRRGRSGFELPSYCFFPVKVPSPRSPIVTFPFIVAPSAVPV